MASDAVRLTETLRIATAAIGAQVKDKTPEQLLTAAASRRRGNFDAAEKLAGAAIIAAPKDPANWLTYAGVAITADDAKANDRYELVTRGATAAYAAYLRSTTPDAQAAALAELADLLARHELWRPALDALKASLDRRDLIDVRKTYEAMRAEHGFRILDYKVDNEFDLVARLFQLFRTAPREGRIFRPTSRFPARPIPRSRTRTSRFASRASNMASATQSCCAEACPRRSGSSF